jgi:hypothetical protein
MIKDLKPDKNIGFYIDNVSECMYNIVTDTLSEYRDILFFYKGVANL